VTLKIDFENIEQKCVDATMSSEYALLVEKLIKAKKIFLIGNGGLHFVANHMATDLTRLIEDKVVYSFESVGFITSTANDHGFEKMFVRWLETVCSVEDPNDCLIIGLSCSGNSSNVIRSLHWGQDNGVPTFLMSGQKSLALNEGVDELSFNCEYFHTVEVMCMMLFYDLIHRVGSHCPSITEEKKRMADSPLRKVENE
jgi:phosphoheptose isomerase